MAEPIPAQKAPYGVNIEAGKDYWWCAMRAQREPTLLRRFTQIGGLAPQKFSATETKQVWLCGSSSANKPFCDRSHKSI